jgi:lysophospholipase L1-like esterase
MKRALLLYVALLFLPALSRAADKELFFKNGDRIVFLGDSITEQYQYSTDIELYLTTRFPQWNLAFINAGIGGDTATGGASRFQRHVLDEKPTAITINFGMNDAGYQKFNQQSNDNFKKQTTMMLKMAKKAGVRFALLSPNAVDPRVSPGFSDFRVYLETQKQYYAPLKDLAAEYGATFVDQYAKTRAALEKMEADDPKAQKVKPFDDGFHTAPAGGLFMAHAILTGLGAPALVSDVEINAASGTSAPKACRITEMKASTNGVTFTRLDDAIPMPVPPEWASVLPYVNGLKDLNYYGLKVTGLASAKYTLLIDGKDVGSFTADQLAVGVNLGNLTTGPIYQQGKEVLDAINTKNDIVHQRFRGVVMFQAPDWLADVAAERKPKELAKRMQQIDDQQAAIYKKVQPVERRFELKQTP